MYKWQVVSIFYENEKKREGTKCMKFYVYKKWYKNTLFDMGPCDSSLHDVIMWYIFMQCDHRSPWDVAKWYIFVWHGYLMKYNSIWCGKVIYLHSIWVCNPIKICSKIWCCLYITQATIKNINHKIISDNIWPFKFLYTYYARNWRSKIIMIR